MAIEREIIVDSLIEILEKNQYSHIVEKAVLDKYDYLPNNEKAFIKRTIEGTIENLIPIDEVINQYSKVKVNKLKPMIRTILRMSIYQLLYMDKIPDSAVCNEAVKIANKRGFRTLSGFVNGILRNISRNKSDIKIDDLNVLPSWLMEHFKTNYGEDTANIIVQDIKKEHPVVIRERKKLKDVSNMTKVSYLDNAYIVNKGISIADIKGYNDGDFIVQDISSQMVCNIAGIKAGDVVIDVCAAPGGKSIHACDLGAYVYASDISQKKIDYIKQNAKRCNVDNITIKVQDATILDESMLDKADVLIADVPCSGLGVIGKKSDIRFKVKKEDLDKIVQIQKKIIDTVHRYVKKGGILMYSTCTLNPDENEKMAQYIVDNYSFEMLYEKQFIPGIDGTDGFYLSKLKKL